MSRNRRWNLLSDGREFCLHLWLAVESEGALLSVDPEEWRCKVLGDGADQYVSVSESRYVLCRHFKVLARDLLVSKVASREVWLNINVGAILGWVELADSACHCGIDDSWL